MIASMEKIDTSATVGLRGLASIHIMVRMIKYMNLNPTCQGLSNVKCREGRYFLPAQPRSTEITVKKTLSLILKK